MPKYIKALRAQLEDVLVVVVVDVVVVGLGLLVVVVPSGGNAKKKNVDFSRTLRGCPNVVESNQNFFSTKKNKRNATQF
jgi:hypothetical protein